MNKHGSTGKSGNKNTKTLLIFSSKKMAIISIAIALFFVMSIGIAIVLVVVLRDKPNVDPVYFAAPANALPTEDKFALEKYDYADLSGVQTTLRADAGAVTARDLPRAVPQMLSNEYSIVYDTAKREVYPVYDKVESGNGLKVANITFNKDFYPSPKKAAVSSAYAQAAAAAGKTADQYFNYYKYMLISQGQNLEREASRRSALTAIDNSNPNASKVNADFAAWLKKHPAADDQYGRVLGENNAVEKVITLDPLYRSFHASGLYLPAGEPVTVKVEGLKDGEKIQIILGVQDSLAWRGGIPANGNELIKSETGGASVNFVNSSCDVFFKSADLLTATGHFYDCNSGDSAPFLQAQWKRQNARLPWLHGDFTFDKNMTYTIGNAFGGAIHIGMGNSYSKVKLTIRGAVETPHYILGVTTPDYFDQYLRQAPGVIAIMDTENGQLTGPTGEMGTTSYMRKVTKDEVDKLAMLWHSFFSVNESFTGGTYNRFNKVMFDWHVPAGAAVSLGNYSFAQPTGWFDGVMNYSGLLKTGNWGTLHEIGHNHGNAYGSVWGFGDGMEGEVRNNALTLLAYILFCDIGTTVRHGGTAEHGAYANPYNTLYETISNKGKFADHNACGYFQALGMYANIMHSFGAEKFYELLYTYKSRPSYAEEGTAGNKRSDFAYRCSLVYGMNFVKYFNDFYSAKITDNMFSAEQLEYISKLPNYEPISCYYAGTIDGVKTAGDYKVAFGNDIEFDLTKNTISTLDTADKKGFEVISVSQPEHGSISIRTDENGYKKYIYSFDNSYMGTTDAFSFFVKLNDGDGVNHKFTISLRISYNGIKIDSYKNVTATDWKDVIEDIYTRQPDSTFGVAATNIQKYPPSGGKEVRVAHLYWRAPKTGKIRMTVTSDDWVRWYFEDNFDIIENKIADERSKGSNTGGFGQVKNFRSEYNDIPSLPSVDVEQGKYYAIKIINVNTGGDGFASVGYKYEGGSFADFALNDVIHPAFKIENPVPLYVHEPKFMVSKKDNINLSVTGTDKSKWEIVKAPENIDGGRTVIFEQKYLEEKPSEDGLYKFGDVINTREIDKWTYLIDGQTGTNLLTAWRGVKEKITPDKPHEFILDTGNVSSFNYFSVTTRANSNSYITDCELQISNSKDSGYTTIATADIKSYSKMTITMKFSTVLGRYFKLIVKGTTGETFSALAELDAGIQTVTQKVVSITNEKIFATDGWKNTSFDDSLSNGFYLSEKKNEKMVVKFYGNMFSLYSAVGPGYGRFKILIDGDEQTTVDLDTANEDMRKLVYLADNLDNKEHTVEIITTSSGKIMLSLIGLPYSGQLLNAPNIYFERALIISLTVFVLLFAALLAFVLCLVFLPKFRKFMLGNRFIQKLDTRGERAKSKNKNKRTNADNKKTGSASTAHNDSIGGSKPAIDREHEKPQAVQVHATKTPERVQTASAASVSKAPEKPQSVTPAHTVKTPIQPAPAAKPTPVVKPAPIVKPASEKPGVNKQVTEKTVQTSKPAPKNTSTKK